jgi:Spy/CpxP family protein refolding chaperone
LKPGDFKSPTIHFLSAIKRLATARSEIDVAFANANSCPVESRLSLESAGFKGAVMSKTDKRLGKRIFLVTAGIMAGFSNLTAPSVVHAQDGPAPHDANSIYSQAGADKDELDKIKAIGSDFEARSRTNYQSFMDAAQEMQRLSLEPTLDEAKLLATQEKMNKLTSDMANDRIKQLVACRNVLTPDQRNKLVELLRKRREANAAGLGKQ